MTKKSVKKNRRNTVIKNERKHVKKEMEKRQKYAISMYRAKLWEPVRDEIIEQRRRNGRRFIQAKKKNERVREDAKLSSSVYFQRVASSR